MRFPVLLLALSACGVPRWSDLTASPASITLLGPEHARAIAIAGRTERGVVELVPPEALRFDPADPAIAHVAGGRVRAVRAGTVVLTAIAADETSVDLAVTVLDLPPPFITELVAQTRGVGDGYGRNNLPGVIQGPPRGAGLDQGGTHALSLGVGGSITVSFAPLLAYDGPGPDLIVFENPFRVAGRDVIYAEPAGVEVARGGDPWRAFACAPEAAPYPGCAGVAPVLAGPAAPELDPTDPVDAGGDQFDLAALELEVIDLVRITDAATGTITANSSGFDLDSAAIVHALPPGAAALVASQPSLQLRAGERVLEPRFDVTHAGGTVHGAAVITSVEGPVELEPPFLRAVAPGRAVLTARAGPFVATTEIEVLP